MKKLISYKLSFVIVLTALIVLPIPIFAMAENSSEHKYGQFRELCGQVGVKDSCGNQLIEGELKTFPISMHMQAGSGEWWPWPGGTRTIHSGVGYIEPFGEASYSCGIGYPEQALFPKPAFLDAPSWKAMFSTGLFCIYMLEDGWIIAYDGVMGGLKPSGWNGILGNKMDELINVVIGGTGAYEGAIGMWVGHTEGWGPMAPAGTPGAGLPKSLFKILDGYIKLP